MELTEIELDFLRGLLRAKIADLNCEDGRLGKDPESQAKLLNIGRAVGILAGILAKAEAEEPR